MTITYKKQESETQVKEGIDFLLSHFEGRQRLFPRKMSTSTSQGKQFIVYNIIIVMICNSSYLR